MTTFRRRTGKIKEYSGHDKVSIQLRNRIIGAITPIVDRVSGAYRFDPYDETSIHVSHIEAELDKEYGANDLDLFKILENYPAEDLFTAIEIVFRLARELIFSMNFDVFKKELRQAFSLSGSVYGINRHGDVVLNINDETAKSVDEALAMVSDYETASKKLQEAIGGLIARKEPTDVIRDAYLAMESYIIAVAKTSGKNAFGDGVKKLLSNRPVQKAMISKLKGFKGNAKGISHDGNYVPDEIDALWYLNSVVATISFVNSVVSQNKSD